MFAHRSTCPIQFNFTKHFQKYLYPYSDWPENENSYLYTDFINHAITQMNN